MVAVGDDAVGWGVFENGSKWVDPLPPEVVLSLGAATSSLRLAESALVLEVNRRRPRRPPWRKWEYGTDSRDPGGIRLRHCGMKRRKATTAWH